MRRYRHRLVPMLIVVVAALGACTPIASWVRDNLDTGAGATLVYAQGGLVFDPGPLPAYQAHFTARGEDLTPLDASLECEVHAEGRYLDCALGTVATPVFVHMSGRGVIASVMYTREPTGLAFEWAYTPVGSTQ